MSLAYQKGGFGADKAAVILELRLGEVAGQDDVDHALPPVQVLLQFPGVVSLTEEQSALVKEGVLKRRRQNVYQLALCLVVELACVSNQTGTTENMFVV